MNRPSLLTRLLGGRVISLMLLPACVVAGVWCMAGDGSWWLGLFAVVMALKTLSAIGLMRRYKAWAAQWQAMAEPIRMPHTGSSQQEADVDQRPSPRVKTARRGRLGVILAVVMLLGIPSYVASATDTVSSGLLCVCGSRPAATLCSGSCGARRGAAGSTVRRHAFLLRNRSRRVRL